MRRAEELRTGAGASQSTFACLQPRAGGRPPAPDLTPDFLPDLPPDSPPNFPPPDVPPELLFAVNQEHSTTALPTCYDSQQTSTSTSTYRYTFAEVLEGGRRGDEVRLDLCMFALKRRGDMTDAHAPPLHPDFPRPDFPPSNPYVFAIHQQHPRHDIISNKQTLRPGTHSRRYWKAGGGERRGEEVRLRVRVQATPSLLCIIYPRDISPETS